MLAIGLQSTGDCDCILGRPFSQEKIGVFFLEQKIAENIFISIIMYHISSYIWARVGIVFITSVGRMRRYNCGKIAIEPKSGNGPAH